MNDFSMSSDEVMSLFVDYEVHACDGSIYTWDEFMSMLDEELARQWDDQQEWMDLGTYWDYTH